MKTHKPKPRVRTLSNGGIGKDGYNYRQFIMSPNLQLRPIVSCTWDFSSAYNKLVAEPLVSYQTNPTVGDLLFKYKWRVKDNSDVEVLTVSEWLGDKWNLLYTPVQNAHLATLRKNNYDLYSWLDSRGGMIIPTNIVSLLEYQSIAGKIHQLKDFAHWGFSTDGCLFDRLNIYEHLVYTPSSNLRYKASVMDLSFLKRHKSSEDYLIGFTKSFVDDKMFMVPTLLATNASVYAFDINNVPKDYDYVCRITKVLGLVDYEIVTTSIIVDNRYARSKPPKKRIHK